MRTIDVIQSEWWDIQKIIDTGGLSLLEIQELKKDQSDLHYEAEGIRASWGYKGGDDGSKFIPIADDPTTDVDETGRFDAFFGGNSSDKERQRRINIIEASAYYDPESDLVILDSPSQGEPPQQNGIIDSIVPGVNIGNITKSVNSDSIGNIAIFAIVALFLTRIISGVFK